MKERNKISVAMAVYNGEKYIKQQIVSILNQLSMEDELVISMDPSTDSSFNIVNDMAAEDARIHIYSGPGLGVIKNFENAILYCRNNIIFLADQDDIWKPNKVEVVMQKFCDLKVMVVLHDAEIIDEKGTIIESSFFELKGCKTGMCRNILKNSYIGCCMAFRRECMKKILPFPDKIPMHDQWIGIIGETMGKSVLVPKSLIMYRRHESNFSDMKHASLGKMIKWRTLLVLELVKRMMRR